MLPFSYIYATPAIGSTLAIGSVLISSTLEGEATPILRIICVPYMCARPTSPQRAYALSMRGRLWQAHRSRLAAVCYLVIIPSAVAGSAVHACSGAHHAPHCMHACAFGAAVLTVLSSGCADRPRGADRSGLRLGLGLQYGQGYGMVTVHGYSTVAGGIL